MFNWDSIELKERKYAYKQLSMNKTIEEKTDLLRNMFSGKECVCLATGPSLLDYSKQAIDEFCKDKVVVSVKTAAVRHLDVTDICVTNFYNSYKFSNDEPFLILARQEVPLGNKNFVNRMLVEHSSFMTKLPFKPDILWGCNNLVAHSKSVCYANRWNENELTKQKVNRILGPGILNDMAIPVMVHLGVKKIYFLGWDGSQVDNRGRVKHFYKIDRTIQPNINVIREDLDCRILKADTAKHEQEIVTNSEIDIYRYLSSKRISPFILSTQSHVDKVFKRQKINVSDP